MKKICIGLIAAILMLLPLMTTGCAGEEEEIVEIREQFFVRQVEYILRNIDNFTGSTIQLEGVFISDTADTFAANTYHFVLRGISDCCGGGGSVGFEVDLGGFAPPANQAWVSVTGVLEVRDSWLPDNPVLVLTSIEEPAERGQEVVMR